MKNRWYTLIFLIISFLVFTDCSAPSPVSSTPMEPTRVPTPQPTQISPSPQETVLKRMESDSAVPLDADFQNGFPIYIKGSFFPGGADPIQRAQNFLDAYADLYGLQDEENYLSVKRLAGEERQHVVFFQTYRDIPVHGGELTVFQQGEVVIGTVGALYTPGDLSTEPDIPAQQAERLMRAELDIPENQSASGETALVIYDRGLYDKSAPDAHLAWRVSFGGAYPWLGFVDANDGEVLETSPRRREMIHTIPFTIRDYAGFTRGDADCYDYPILADYYIADDVYFDYDYDDSPDAVEGRQYIRDTYNFYKDTFGHWSFDGADLMEIPVILFVSWPGAWYLPECMVIEISEGYVSDDTMTHEYTHGVLEATSGLFLSGQSGSLNESYADIMGSLNDDDWTIREDCTDCPGIVRDLSDPPAYGQPDHMDDFDYATSDTHLNNGIPNKVAYLIAEGGSHYGTNVTGLGREKMGALYYSTMTSLPARADFMAARNATVTIAETWAASNTYGFTSFDVCQVKNAFHSVGLGLGDEDCDGIPEYEFLDMSYVMDVLEILRGTDNDYIEPPDDNCVDVFNLLQRDTDQDGLGDECDPDDDNDGILDEVDNCLKRFNPDQADADGDGIGDACKPQQPVPDTCQAASRPDLPDSDKDGVIDSCDTCPKTPDPDQLDADGDGQGDACDDDDDEDGRADSKDNCPLVRNPNQLDWDGDGEGAACEQALDFNRCGTLMKAENFPTLIPLPSCLPDCNNFEEERFGLTISLEGLSEGMKVWAVNGLGSRVASAETEGETHVLRFRPIGGERYYLRFTLPENIKPGEWLDLCLDVDTGILPDREPAPSVTFLSTANCRSRPSSSHPILSSFQAGEQAPVVGRNLNMTWYEVMADDGQTVCWVWVKQVEFEGDLDAVPVRPPEIISEPDEEQELEKKPKPTPTCGPNQNCK